jgi:hypothetical protein
MTTTELTVTEMVTMQTKGQVNPESLVMIEVEEVVVCLSV